MTKGEVETTNKREPDHPLGARAQAVDRPGKFLPSADWRLPSSQLCARRQWEWVCFPLNVSKFIQFRCLCDLTLLA